MRPVAAMTTDEIKKLVLKNIGKTRSSMPEDESMFNSELHQEWIKREGAVTVALHLKRGYMEKKKLETGK